MTTVKPDYSVRYSSNYSSRVAAAHKLHNLFANGICCCCMDAPAEEIHHTSYGKDHFGVNWFPVCKHCHDTQCHSKKNWVRYSGIASVWGNHNKAEFTQLLAKNHKELYKNVGE